MPNSDDDCLMSAITTSCTKANGHLCYQINLTTDREIRFTRRPEKQTKNRTEQMCITAVFENLSNILLSRNIGAHTSTEVACFEVIEQVSKVKALGS